MTITNISGACAPRFVEPGVPGSSLSENLQRAANTDPLPRAAGASDSVLISAKEAYANLQSQASEACFTKEGLSGFVFNSAQKTSAHNKDASARALLDCAVNLHLMRSSGLVAPEALKPVETALEKLAERFQQRPAMSLVTMDLKHRTRYNDYHALTQKIDQLLKEAPAGADKVFDHVQLQLTSAYVVDGLRARVESDWGALTAQDARAVMENGNFTDAAGKVLKGQLKLAKAGGTGQALGEFVRQTLNTLDLHRTGRTAGPDANRHNDPLRSVLPNQLVCCYGGLGGMPNITISPTMTNGHNINDFTDMPTRDILREELGKYNSGASPPPGTHATITTNDSSTSTSSGTGSDGVVPQLISNLDKETASQSTQTDAVEHSNFSSDTEIGDGFGNDQEVDEKTLVQPILSAEGEDRDLSFADYQPSPPFSENALPASSNTGDGSSSVVNNTTPLPLNYSPEPAVHATNMQSENSDTANLLSTLRNGSADISIRTNNLPDAYVIDFGRPLSKRNENFNRSVSEAIQLGFDPMQAFIDLKSSLADGMSLANLQKDPAYQAAAEFNSSFALRMTLLLNARDNAAIPAAFKPGQLPYVNGAASGQPAIIETPGTPTAEEFLTMLNAGNAGVRVVLNNLPGQAPINFNGDVDAQGNNTAVSNFNKQIKSVLQLHATVHPAFEQIRADLGEGKSQVEMRENPAYVALCTHSPALESRLNRLVYASKRGNDSADRNGADSPEVNLTAGRNHYLSFNPSSLALVNR